MPDADREGISGHDSFSWLARLWIKVFGKKLDQLRIAIMLRCK